MPGDLQVRFFDFHWSNEKVWALDFPTTRVSVRSLLWLLDLPVWASAPPERIFDLAPREVVCNLAQYRSHAARIANADISHPLDLMQNLLGEWVILDGYHRLAKLYLAGEQVVSARRLPRTVIPAIAPQNSKPRPSRPLALDRLGDEL